LKTGAPEGIRTPGLCLRRAKACAPPFQNLPSNTTLNLDLRQINYLKFQERPCRHRIATVAPARPRACYRTHQAHATTTASQMMKAAIIDDVFRTILSTSRLGAYRKRRSRATIRGYLKKSLSGSRQGQGEAIIRSRLSLPVPSRGGVGPTYTHKLYCDENALFPGNCQSPRVAVCLSGQRR
jgi:hypothetical protein